MYSPLVLMPCAASIVKAWPKPSRSLPVFGSESRFQSISALATRVGQNQAGGRLADHLDDVAVVADRGALVLDALARHDVQARSYSFDRGLGEATEEFLGRHIAEASVGADRVAGDPGRKAAAAMAERAGEDICERLARDYAQAFDVVAEAPALGDRLNKFCASSVPGTVCLDRYIAGVQGKDEQPDQGGVIDRVYFQPLDQRLGAQCADDLVALMRDLGPGLLRGERLVAIVVGRASLGFLWFRLKTTSWTLPSRGWIV
jgi:hypothetical protein